MYVCMCDKGCHKLLLSTYLQQTVRQLWLHLLVMAGGWPTALKVNVTLALLCADCSST